jgi:hypothetical protein
MFMDDSTLYEVLDVSNHISGMPIADLLGKINRVVKFTEGEKMTLNLKKYTEMRWLLTFERTNLSSHRWK